MTCGPLVSFSFFFRFISFPENTEYMYTKLTLFVVMYLSFLQYSSTQ